MEYLEGMIKKYTVWEKYMSQYKKADIFAEILADLRNLKAETSDKPKALNIGDVVHSLPTEKDIHSYVISEMKNSSNVAVAFFRTGADWMRKNIKQ